MQVVAERCDAHDRAHRTEAELRDACRLNLAAAEVDPVVGRCARATWQPEPLERHKPGHVLHLPREIESREEGGDLQQGLVLHVLNKIESREGALNQGLRHRDTPGMADRDLGNHTGAQPGGCLPEPRLLVRLEGCGMLRASARCFDQPRCRSSRMEPHPAYIPGPRDVQADNRKQDPLRHDVCCPRKQVTILTATTTERRCGCATRPYARTWRGATPMSAPDYFDVTPEFTDIPPGKVVVHNHVRPLRFAERDGAGPRLRCAQVHRGTSRQGTRLTMARP